MNEEFVNILYSIAQQNGYEDAVEDFKELISTNPDLVSDMYSLANQNGYEDPIEDFEILVGFQKKKRQNRNRYGFRIGNWYFSAKRIIKKPAS